jgi:hypothetical protein
MQLRIALRLAWLAVMVLAAGCGGSSVSGSTLAGSWQVSIVASAVSGLGTMTLTENNDSLSGNVDFSGTLFGGSTVLMNITGSVGGTSINLEFTDPTGNFTPSSVSGTVSGSNMSGNYTYSCSVSGQCSAQFTAIKR